MRSKYRRYLKNASKVWPDVWGTSPLEQSSTFLVILMNNPCRSRWQSLRLAAFIVFLLRCINPRNGKLTSPNVLSYDMFKLTCVGFEIERNSNSFRATCVRCNIKFRLRLVFDNDPRLKRRRRLLGETSRPVRDARRCLSSPPYFRDHFKLQQDVSFTLNWMNFHINLDRCVRCLLS